MAKNKPKPRKQRGFPPVDTPAKPTPATSSTTRSVRWDLVALFLIISIGGTYLAITMRPQSDPPPRFSYDKKREFRHDPKAFTQGLVLDQGFLWESTGQYGESSIRKVDLESGEVLNQTKLDDQYFGEGLAIHDDRLYQLTWKSERVFVYDRDLKKVDEFKYEGQGWGLTSNGTQLIMSNGSPEIRFLDPKTFEVVRSIWVKRPGPLIPMQLNELEYFDGRIYANNYQTDLIYEIDPELGVVTREIDLTGIWPSAERPDSNAVLNGIAINPENDRVLVTGKYCPKIFEIKFANPKPK